MTKVLGIAAIALAMSLGLFASVALGVTLPSQANQLAVDATSGAHSGADVTGHPSADVNGVPPGPSTCSTTPRRSARPRGRTRRADPPPCLRPRCPAVAPAASPPFCRPLFAALGGPPV